ncbi:hypothetical protein M9H77_23012 [Catharanthus roseus]|uniref:Uncharacterized protein n=1 Tax=Catharanthus roseus TaxID=4058 RepID=A0ACC0AU88_CATRO|nr:hypothetical protein M9H77_23012 [Catharanthus roseus]
MGQSRFRFPVLHSCPQVVPTHKLDVLGLRFAPHGHAHTRQGLILTIFPLKICHAPNSRDVDLYHVQLLALQLTILLYNQIGCSGVLVSPLTCIFEEKLQDGVNFFKIPKKTPRLFCLSVCYAGRSTSLRTTFLLEKFITTGIYLLVYFPFQLSNILDKRGHGLSHHTHFVHPSSSYIFEDSNISIKVIRSHVDAEAFILASSYSILSITKSTTK